MTDDDDDRVSSEKREQDKRDELTSLVADTPSLAAFIVFVFFRSVGGGRWGMC